MSTLQKDKNDKTGDYRVRWTPMSPGTHATAIREFCDAITGDALCDGSISVAAKEDVVVFCFRLTKIWRDNLPVAEELIDAHATKWLPV